MKKTAPEEIPYFDQDLFIKAEARGPLSSKAYRDLESKLSRAAKGDGIDRVMIDKKLDALVAPTDSPAWPTDYILGDHSIATTSTPAAVAGYPHVTVPAGQIYGLPVGLSFFGSPRTEIKLIRYAYAFEQATTARKPPQYLPTVQNLKRPKSMNADSKFSYCEVELRQAQLAGDVAVLDRLLDDQLLFTNIDGTLASKGDDLSLHRSGQLRITRMDPIDRRIVHLGATSVVSDVE